MKKYLPIILVALGVLVLGGVYYFVANRTKEVTEEEPESVAEIPLADRPFTSLSPFEDDQGCVELKMKIAGVKVAAKTLDYELLYDVPSKAAQGVPGTIDIKEGEEIERDLLIGSESSGKKRCDDGVQRGSLTLRFRDDKGKLVGKLSTEFHLQSDETQPNFQELTSLDGMFNYLLDKKVRGVHFLTMSTFGLPADAPIEVKKGPYGVFSSSTSPMPGQVGMAAGNVYRWTGEEWEKIESGDSKDIGVFINDSQ